MIKNISDQGPWGGHREILWETNKPNSFTESDVIQFSQSHGWKFVDSSYHYSCLSNNWNKLNKIVSPPFEDTFFNNWATTDLKLLRFDSRWTIERPDGSGEFDTAFAYILLNRDRSKMMFIHLWGE